MSFISFQRADAVHEQEAKAKAIQVTDAASVCEYLKEYFTLIYNHKMFGYVYDIYADNITVKRENGQILKGIPAVELEIMQMNTAFPDLTVSIKDIFAVPNGENGFKVWMRYYFAGTNNGYRIYGPPTGLSMTGDQAINLSVYYLEKVENEWLITGEMTGRPCDWIRAVCTGDSSFAAHL